MNKDFAAAAGVAETELEEAEEAEGAAGAAMDTDMEAIRVRPGAASPASAAVAARVVETAEASPPVRPYIRKLG